MGNKYSELVTNLQELMRKTQEVSTDQNLRNILGITRQISGIRIAIEYKCGESCKTVYNGRFIIPNSGVILLIPDNDEKLCLKEYSNGKLVKKQLELIAIPFDKISSFDFYERRSRNSTPLD